MLTRILLLEHHIGWPLRYFFCLLIYYFYIIIIICVIDLWPLLLSFYFQISLFFIPDEVLSIVATIQGACDAEFRIVSKEYMFLGRRFLNRNYGFILELFDLVGRVVEKHECLWHVGYRSSFLLCYLYTICNRFICEDKMLFFNFLFYLHSFPL